MPTLTGCTSSQAQDSVLIVEAQENPFINARALWLLKIFQGRNMQLFWDNVGLHGRMKLFESRIAKVTHGEFASGHFPLQCTSSMFPIRHSQIDHRNWETASSLWATVTKRMWTENDTKLISSSFWTSQRAMNSSLTVPDSKHCYAE